MVGFRNRSAGRLAFLVFAVLAGIIVLHIIFVLLGANPGNAIVSTDASWAGTLAAWFKGLFSPSSHRLSVTLNYGIAAVFYLVVGRIVEKLIDLL